MKITLEKIVNSDKSLAKLMGLKLPIKVSYKLTRLAFNLQPEITIFNDKRNAIIKELGEPMADSPVVNGEPSYKVKDENMAKYIEEMTKLGEIEVDLKFSSDKEFEKIKILDLGDVSIEPRELLPVDWLLEE